MARPHKILRCRYFDERGRALKPYCSSGPNCGFVHPQDPNWPTAKYASEVYGNHDRTRGPPPRPRTRSPSQSRRPYPPPPQGDTPSRFKTENHMEEPWPDVGRHRDLDRPQEFFAASSSNSRIPDYGIGPPRRVQSPIPISSPAKQAPLPPSRTATMDRPQAGASATNEASSRTQPPPTPRSGLPTSESASAAPQQYSVDKRRIEKIVELFRLLSDTTNQTTADSALAEAEHRKVQAYTDIATSFSSALDDASGMIPKSVGPALADLIASHKRLKEQADAGYARVGHLWQDVFGAFVEGLVDELQAAVDKQLARLRRESAGAIADMVRSALDKELALERARQLERERELERMRAEREQATTLERQRQEREETEVANTLKRKPSMSDMTSGSHGYHPQGSGCGYMEDPRDKRRRLDSPPMMVDGLTVPRGREAHPKLEMLDSNDMLRQMKDMLEQVKADNARIQADNIRLSKQLAVAHREASMRPQSPAHSSAHGRPLSPGPSRAHQNFSASYHDSLSGRDRAPGNYDINMERNYPGVRPQGSYGNMVDLSPVGVPRDLPSRPPPQIQRTFSSITELPLNEARRPAEMNPQANDHQRPMPPPSMPLDYDPVAYARRY